MVARICCRVLGEAASDVTPWRRTALAKPAMLVNTADPPALNAVRQARSPRCTAEPHGADQDGGVRLSRRSGTPCPQCAMPSHRGLRRKTAARPWCPRFQTRAEPRCRPRPRRERPRMPRTSRIPGWTARPAMPSRAAPGWLPRAAAASGHPRSRRRCAPRPSPWSAPGSHPAPRSTTQHLARRKPGAWARCANASMCRSNASVGQAGVIRPDNRHGAGPGAGKLADAVRDVHGSPRLNRPDLQRQRTDRARHGPAAILALAPLAANSVAPPMRMHPSLSRRDGLQAYAQRRQLLG